NSWDPTILVCSSFILSLCKKWVRIRAPSRGLLERLGLLVHRLATLPVRYSCSHCGRGGSADHTGDIRRPAPTAASVGDARRPNRFGSCRPDSPAPLLDQPLPLCRAGA